MPEILASVLGCIQSSASRVLVPVAGLSVQDAVKVAEEHGLNAADLKTSLLSTNQPALTAALTAQGHMSRYSSAN